MNKQVLDVLKEEGITDSYFDSIPRVDKSQATDFLMDCIKKDYRLPTDIVCDNRLFFSADRVKLNGLEYIDLLDGDRHYNHRHFDNKLMLKKPNGTEYVG